MTQKIAIKTLRKELNEIIVAKNSGAIEIQDAITRLNQLKQKVNELFPDEETKEALMLLSFSLV